ncbi:MAG: hypothetical protein HY053_02485 [Proteobacteria bacterium]|nr:hypothetical protein [Pseudomonadota bacterium]
MPAQAIAVSSVLEERLKGRRAALGALRDLPEDYVLFYSPSLRGGTEGRDAEPVVDYVLAHKEKGLLGVVVKSGEIVEEPGGFISQYQPLRQIYKIIDPVRPADMALRALLMNFDLASNKTFPCGVAVLFPETKRLEFAHPQSCYLFSGDINTPDFIKKLDDLFLESVGANDRAKFQENFGKLCEFLMRHSDNAAVFEERTEKLKAISQAKKATPPVSQGNLRMKVAAAQGVEIRPAMVQKAQTAPPVAKAPEASPAVEPKPAQAPQAQEAKPLAIAKAEKQQTSVAISLASPPRKRLKAAARVSVPAKEQQQDFFTWMQDVQQKGEADAALSAGQWVMVVGISVAVICVVYFLSANLATILRG